MARHDCIECIEGKHGACNGTAYVDFGDDQPLAEEECHCADLNHHNRAQGEPSMTQPTHQFQNEQGTYQDSRSALTDAERSRLNQIIGRNFYRPVHVDGGQ